MRPDIAILSPLARHVGRAHGGITPVVTALCDGLCRAGARVELLGLGNDDPRERLASVAGDVGVHVLGQGHQWQQARRLRHYLAERAPAALLAAGHRANVLAARQAGGSTRVVLSVHNAITPGMARLNPMRRWARLRALRRWYPGADAIVCVSHGVATDVERLMPRCRELLHCIHNPVASAPVEPSLSLHPWLEDRSRPVILGAGRLTAQKGFDSLIRAFAQVQHRPPGPRLLILGEGPDRNALLQLADQLGVASRVALPGFVPNPRAQMAAAAVFVLASRWEGFGNVVVEAMAAGTPVVATDCPSGPREILADGAYGALVGVDDLDAMASAITRTLDAPMASTRLRARAADFAPEQVAARYLALLLPPGRVER
jgi:glycosyltransferase involved in cell wall biosynthesis